MTKFWPLNLLFGGKIRQLLEGALWAFILWTIEI